MSNEQGPTLDQNGQQMYSDDPAPMSPQAALSQLQGSIAATAAPTGPVMDVPAPLAQQQPAAPAPVTQLGTNVLQGLPEQQPTAQVAPKALNAEEFAQTPQAQEALATGGLPGLLKTYHDQLDASVRNTLALGGAQQTAAAEQGKVLQSFVEQNQKWQVEQEERRNDREDAVDQAMLDLGKTKDEFRTMSSNAANPQAAWDRAVDNMGGKVMAAIAIGLGAAGGTLSHRGGNVALDIINKAVDRDIDFQKSKIAEKGQEYNMQAGLYGRMLEQYKNEDMAEAASKSLYNQQIQLQLEQKALTLKGTTAGLTAQALAEQAKMAGTQFDMQFQRAAMSAALENQANGGGQAGGGVSNPNDPEMRSLTPVQRRLLDKETLGRHLDGYGFTTGTKEDRDKFQNEARVPIESTIGAVKDVMKAAKESSRLNPSDRVKMESRMGLLVGGLKEAMGYKTMTVGDQEFLTKLTGDPNSLLSPKSWQLDKLQGIVDSQAEKLRSTAIARGFKPPRADGDVSQFKSATDVGLRNKLQQLGYKK